MPKQWMRVPGPAAASRAVAMRSRVLSTCNGGAGRGLARYERPGISGPLAHLSIRKQQHGARRRPKDARDLLRRGNGRRSHCTRVDGSARDGEAAAVDPQNRCAQRSCREGDAQRLVELGAAQVGFEPLQQRQASRERTPAKLSKQRFALTESSSVTRARFASVAGTTGASGKTGETLEPKRMTWKREPAGMERTASCTRVGEGIQVVTERGFREPALLPPASPAALRVRP